MATVSPYQVFWNWIFDGKKNSPIPQQEVLLKYNSPITCTYLMRSFIGNAKLNLYMNTYMNNLGLRYIKLEDLFKFIKQAVKDFKVRRKSIHYITWERKTTLYEKVRKKFPLLKGHEVSLFCDLIDKSPEKDSVYSSFGIDKPKKQNKKNGKKSKKKINQKNFIAENFNLVNV